MERQRLRYEAIGMIRARAIAIKARGAALRAWLRGGDLHATMTAVAVHLSPLIPVVTDGMLAGHLAGVLRTQEKVVERGKDRRGIRLSSAYENALRFLRERTGMTQEQQDSLQTRYDTAATQVVVGATRQAQDKIANAVAESIKAGDSVKRGATKIAEAFEAAGLGTQKKHTLEQVFRTQTQLAYSAGRMNSLADPAVQEILWGFEYVTVGDARVRPTHKEMDGHKAPKDDPIWQRWTPPNGYNCRCAILEIFDKGVPSAKTPDVQPDKGFAFNPGDLTEGVADPAMPIQPLVPQTGRFGGLVTYGQNDDEKLLNEHIKERLKVTADVQTLIAAAVPDAEKFSTVQVSTSGGIVRISASTPDGSSVSRAIGIVDGRLTMENSTFFLSDADKGKGYGTQFFSDQVENARAIGIERIITSAAGNKNSDQNGYYTWPRLGYDGRIGLKLDRQTREQLGLTPDSKVSELMATPEGRALWKEKGGTFDAEFDLDPQSLSSRVLEAYKRERAARGQAT